MSGDFFLGFLTGWVANTVGLLSIVGLFWWAGRGQAEETDG